MNRDINFFEVYSYTKHSKTLNKVVVLVVMLLILSVVALGAIYVQMYFKDAQVKAELDEVNSYIHNNENAQKADEINQKSNEIKLLNQYINGVELAKEQYELLPRMSVQIIDTVKACKPSDVSFQTLSFDTATFIIKCKSATADSAAEFVLELSTRTEFSEIRYEGLTANTDQATGQITGYSFFVTCILKGGELS